MEEVKIDVNEFINRVDYIVTFLRNDENLEGAYIYFKDKYEAVISLVYSNITNEIQKLAENLSFPNIYKETGINLNVEVLNENDKIYTLAYIFYDRNGKLAMNKVEANKLKLNK